MTDTTAAIAALKTDIKVCMFDQYGTVVDMPKGLTEVATTYLQGKGWTGRPDAFVTWWRRTHFENSMMVVLSNGDPDMLQAAKAWHKAPFDEVISVATAQSALWCDTTSARYPGARHGLTGRTDGLSRRRRFRPFLPRFR